MSNVLQIVTAGSIREGLSYLSVPESGAEVTILPSSLHRNDLASRELRELLRQHRVATHLRVPSPAVPALLGRRARGWTAASLDLADGLPGFTCFLPTSLTEAESVWSVTDVDAISGRGPYVLDLVARYADLPTRLRLLASPRRAELAVALFHARPIQRQVIVRHFASFELVISTSDPIIAELVALALVDEDITRDHQVAGPWEDDLVQRATERDLGVRVPDDIVVNATGMDGNLIHAALSRILGRIGINFDPRSGLPSPDFEKIDSREQV